MPRRDYSRQFKLDCVHQGATRLQPARNVPLSSVASTVLPRASSCAGEKNLMSAPTTLSKPYHPFPY